MLASESAVPARGVHVLTVDLEDWHDGLSSIGVQRASAGSRIEVSTQRLLDIIDHFDARATFFVLGRLLPKSTQLVREIKARGHEIGSHGTAHKRADQLGPLAFRRDIR